MPLFLKNMGERGMRIPSHYGGALTQSPRAWTRLHSCFIGSVDYTLLSIYFKLYTYWILCLEILKFNHKVLFAQFWDFLRLGHITPTELESPFCQADEVSSRGSFGHWHYFSPGSPAGVLNDGITLGFRNFYSGARVPREMYRGHIPHRTHCHQRP